MTRSDAKPYDSAAEQEAVAEQARDAAEEVAHVPSWWLSEARRFRALSDVDTWPTYFWPPPVRPPTA